MTLRTHIVTSGITPTQEHRGRYSQGHVCFSGCLRLFPFPMGFCSYSIIPMEADIPGQVSLRPLGAVKPVICLPLMSSAAEKLKYKEESRGNVPCLLHTHPIKLWVRGHGVGRCFQDHCGSDALRLREMTQLGAVAYICNPTTREGETDKPLELPDLMVSPCLSERPFSKYKTLSN